jgi:hypothetical protein
MRVRDIINDSLDQVTLAGLLPRDPHAHAPYDGETQAPPRSNSTFSAKDMEIARRIGSPPFAGDTEAWRHAFEFVEEFTAGCAARNKTRNWPLPPVLGPFVPKAGEIYDQLCFAFEQASLRQFTPRNTLHKASFAATETLAVKKLPGFYGLYLLEWKAQKNPWDRNIELRVQVDLSVEQRPGGTVASIALTAAAVSAVATVEDSMARFAAPAKSPSPSASHVLLCELAKRWRLPAPPP